VLSFGYANPHASDHYVKSQLGISKRKLAFCRRNLVQAFEDFSGETPYISEHVKPVYLPASIIQ